MLRLRMALRNPNCRVAVVTGAAGHLGGNLVRQLLASGQTVRAVDVRRTAALEGLEVEWRQADLRDPSSIGTAFEGADAVYHLAAVISIAGDPTGRVWSTNVDAVGNVAEAALQSGVRRMVHCSSVHAFDIERSGLSLDEDSPRSLRRRLPVYDRSKAAGEARLRESMEKGLDAVIVNPTGLIGPYDFEPSRMGSFFLALRQRSLRAVVAGAFDWVDVRDVAAALAAASAHGRSGASYLVPGHRLSLHALSRLAARVTGAQVPRLVVPMTVARLGAGAVSALRKSVDSSRLLTAEGLHALRSCPFVVSRRAELELDHHARPAEQTIADIYRWFDLAGYA
jgi:dihydroflavonol-4-reductase